MSGAPSKEVRDRYNKSPKGLAAKERYRRNHGALPIEETKREKHHSWKGGVYVDDDQYHRWYHILSFYKLTKKAFYELLAKQNGLCPVCGDILEPDLYDGRNPESIAVDHDHACCSGEKSCGLCVRGLIHGRCNRGLGFFKDNPSVCRMAAEYLEAFHVEGKN